jgi:hypothetical protein
VSRRKTRIRNEGYDGAGDEVPILVEVDRDDRLDLEDVLGAFMRANIEIGKVVEWNDVEITNRVLSLLGEIRAAGMVIVALRLLLCQNARWAARCGRHQERAQQG